MPHRRRIQGAYTGDPAVDNIAAVRFEVGDVVEGDYLLSDPEIQYALDREGSILKAAARCAESLAARFAREAGERTAQVTLDQSVKYRHYSMLARKLRNRSQRPIHFGSRSGVSAKPQFRIGIHNNREGGDGTAAGSDTEEQSIG